AAGGRLEAARRVEPPRLRPRPPGLRPPPAAGARARRLRGVDRAGDDRRVGRRGDARLGPRRDRRLHLDAGDAGGVGGRARDRVRARPRGDAARVPGSVHGAAARDGGGAAARRELHGERDPGGDDRQHQRVREARLPLPALHLHVPPGPRPVRVTFLGHACHLIELDGLRLLTDPWLVDPIFEGHVERDPPLAFGPGDLPPLDAVLLTHGHLDHFNAPTLAALPDKSIPVVHPEITFTELDVNLRRLGFTNLHARGDWE